MTPPLSRPRAPEADRLLKTQAGRHQWLCFDFNLSRQADDQKTWLHAFLQRQDLGVPWQDSKRMRETEAFPRPPPPRPPLTLCPLSSLFLLTGLLGDMALSEKTGTLKGGHRRPAQGDALACGKAQARRRSPQNYESQRKTATQVCTREGGRSSATFLPFSVKFTKTKEERGSEAVLAVGESRLGTARPSGGKASEGKTRLRPLGGWT